MARHTPRTIADGAARDGQMRALLREHALRCTTARLAVLDILGETPSTAHHLTVPQIQQQLIVRNSEVDLATVYRTVSTLVEVGVLHALAVDENGKTYGLAHEPHHHAVCSRCGVTIGVPAEQLTVALTGPSSEFTLSEHAGMTLTGLCPDCRHDVH